MSLETLASLAEGVIVFFGGYTWHWFLTKRAEKKRSPYTWDCLEQDCVFRVASNDMSITLKLADAHTDTAHKSY